jgi:hypothetical protein
MPNGISRITPAPDYPDVVLDDREAVDAAWGVWVTSYKARYNELNPVLSATSLLPETTGTVVGSVSNPTLVIGNKISINTILVTLTGTTLATTIADINAAAIPGIVATVDPTGIKLQIAVTTAAKSNGSVVDGKLAISNNTGTPLAALGIAASTYTPTVFAGFTYGTLAYTG